MLARYSTVKIIAVQGTGNLENSVNEYLHSQTIETELVDIKYHNDAFCCSVLIITADHIEP